MIAAVTAAPAVAADAPPNDAFAAAAPVVVGDRLSGTTAGATEEAGEPSVAGEGRAFDCSGGSECQRSVWYVLRPSVSGPVSLLVCGAVAEVFTGPGLSSLGGVASNRRGECPAEQTTAFDAVAGMTYWIGVAGHRGAGEPFEARLSAEPDTLGIRGGGYASALPVTFELTARNAGATFECALDDGAFSPCSSRPSFNDLADGSHTLFARALVGPAVDPTPSSVPFSVDRRAPSASITQASPEDGATTSDDTVRFTIASDEAGSVHCAIGDQPLHSCGTPGVQFEIAGLCAAPHTLTAVVVDYAGNVSPPVSSRWTTAQQSACKPPELGTPDSRAGWKTAEVAVPIGRRSKATGARLVLDGPAGTRQFDLAPDGDLVKFPVFDLQPATEYDYTISAKSPQGSSPARTGSFTTTSMPPGRAEASVSDVTEHEATLHGFVDGAGLAIWLFRFGETTGYGRVAPHGWAFPESPQPASFSYRVGGLRSGTLHHYKLENLRTDLLALVEADLADATFTTAGVAPDDGSGGDGGGGDGGGGPPAPAPPAPGPVPGPPAGPGPSAPPGTAQVVSAGRPRLAGRGKKLTLETGLTFECPSGAVACSIQATARAKRGRRRPVIARARRALAAGRREALRLKVTKSGRRALRDRHRLRATLLISVARGGAAPEVIERKLRVAVPRRLR